MAGARMALSSTSSSTVLQRLESQADRLNTRGRSPAQCPLLPKIFEEGGGRRWSPVAPAGPNLLRDNREHSQAGTTSQLSKFSAAVVSINGWTWALEEDLKRTADLLHDSDVPEYVDKAQSANHLNEILTTASPLLQGASAICNFMDTMLEIHVPGMTAMFTLAAAMVHIMSQTVRPGAAFESHRNCAEYYAEVERSIERTLRLPVHEREEGALFRQKIASQLGRSPSKSPLVPFDEKRAGILCL